MAREYAHALAKAAEEATSQQQVSALVQNCIALLKKEGKETALPRIARELGRIAQRQQSYQPTLHVATQKAATQALKELAQLAPEAVVGETQEDQTLIGGWRYTSRDTLIDATHKSALLQLYRTLTAH